MDNSIKMKIHEEVYYLLPDRHLQFSMPAALAGRSFAFFRYHDLDVLGVRVQYLLPLREKARFDSLQLRCIWFTIFLLVFGVYVVESAAKCISIGVSAINDTIISRTL